jgi:hypothetical protein
MPINYPIDLNYEQNYLIVDLGLKTSSYYVKECVDNSFKDLIPACKIYSSDGATC